MSAKTGSRSQPQSSEAAGTGKRKPFGRPFQKGQSGNPGGTPKELREVKRLAISYAPSAIAELWKIGQKAKSESARVAALNSILDRAMGKPKQSVELEGNPERPIEFRGDALDTDEMRQLRELVAKGAAAAAAAAGDDDPDGEA